MTGTLLIGAGGGGDVIAAAMIWRALQRRGVSGPAYFASYAWERREVDPLPGPRDPSAFEGLQRVGERNYRVTPSTAPRTPVRSHLPRLTVDLAGPIFLLDPRRGAVGMRVQLEELVDVLSLIEVIVVDVGGDILARGDEPTLRTPLADFLVLAAVVDLPVSTTLLVAGLGLDAELSFDQAASRCGALGSGAPSMRLTFEDAAGFAEVFERHPSETTGLLWLAAMGYAGRAEIRDQGLVVSVESQHADLYEVDPTRTLESNRLGRDLSSTTSFAAVEDCFRRASVVSELEYERAKADRLRSVERADHVDLDAALARLCEYEAGARDRGIDFISLRRVRDILELSPQGMEHLCALLRNEAHSHYRPPVWLVERHRQMG
ncbi:MAG: DUF1152 domain-containing protein [Egibacteraceae bacterium]